MLVALALGAPGPSLSAAQRLPGLRQEAPVGHSESQRAQPASRETKMRAHAFTRGRDAHGALPHLQVGLRATQHVALHLGPAVLGDSLKPVGVEAVMGNAVVVEVEGAFAGALFVDRSGAIDRLERIVESQR